MAMSRSPQYLTLIRRGDAVFGLPKRRYAPAPYSHPIPFPTAAAFTRDTLCDVASRRGLLDRLEMVGDLAPSAPLSFIVIQLDGLAELNKLAGTDAGDAALRVVADEARSMTRATDLVGRLTGSSFGIVLQGTGATAAACVAARLGFHLSQLPLMSLPASVRVSVATGTGVNSETLPLAAMDSFLHCG